MSRLLPEFVAVGVVLKAHGTRGEVKVKPLTHSPSRFNQLSHLQVEMRNGEVLQMQVEAATVHHDTVCLRLEGVATRDEAEALRGAFLNIPRTDVLPLAEDEFYLFEAIGCQVRTSSGRLLGQVTEVLDLTSNAVLVIKLREQEYLVPAIKDVVVNLDLENGEIVIRPLDGLLD